MEDTCSAYIAVLKVNVVFGVANFVDITSSASYNNR
jgi:hypothetical protein